MFAGSNEPFEFADDASSSGFGNENSASRSESFSKPQADAPSAIDSGTNQLSDYNDDNGETSNPLRIEFGKDEKFRPNYVGFQKDIECTAAQLLEEGQIDAFVEFIHTFAPPTPLRTEVKQDVDDKLAQELHPELAKDENRVVTVLNRQQSVRKLLKVKGGTLVLVYQSDRENDYFKKEIKGNPEYQQNLICKPQTCFDTRDSGASMIIDFKDGLKLYWEIRTSQANQPNDKEWKMIYGDLQQENIVKAYNTTNQMLKKYGTSLEEGLEKSRANIAN